VELQVKWELLLWTLRMRSRIVRGKIFTEGGGVEPGKGQSAIKTGSGLNAMQLL